MRAILSFGRAYEHLRADLSRMVLSIVAVALGVALVVAVRLMSSRVLDGFLEVADGVAGRAALTVTAGDRVTFDERIVQTLEAVPGVAVAAPLVRSVAFPDDDTGEMLTVYGVDLANDAAVRIYYRSDTGQVVDDLLSFIAQKDSIILGRSFAEQRGLGPGGRITLVTPTGALPFTVRGTLDGEGLARALDGRIVIMDIYAAQIAFTARGQISQVELVVAKGQEDAVQAAVERVLPPGLTVEQPALRKTTIRRSIAGFQALLNAFAFIAVLAGFMVCYSRLGAIFEARSWEIGLMRAIGLRRWVVTLELLKESLLLGLAGTIAGIPLGLLIGHLGFPTIAGAAAMQFALPVATADARLQPGAIIIGVVVGLGAAVVAALLPALRIVNKQPAAALTFRGRDTPQQRGPTRMAWWIGLGALAGVLIVGQRLRQQALLGNVTTGILAFLSCAGAWPLVRASSTPLINLWGRLFGPAGRIAAGHLGEQARRASLTVGTFGLGLGAILMFGTVMSSLEGTLAKQLTAMFSADLYVTSAFESDGWMGAPLSPGILQDLQDVPGVLEVAGEQRQTINYSDRPAVLVAYDPVSFTNPRVCQWHLEPGALAESLTRVANGDGVLVSSTFSQQFGLGPGDTIRLSSPNGPQTFQVVGVTTVEPTVAVVLSRLRYRVVWNDEQVRWALVVLAPGATGSMVAADIRRRLGAKYRLEIRSLPEVVAHFTRQVRQAFQFAYVMQAITLVLVLIGVGDTLVSGVLERTREFGMMRAVGLPRARLFAIVVLEGLAIGMLGVLLAGSAGLALAFFWVHMQFRALLGWALQMHFPMGFALTAAAAAVCLALIGSVLPAWRAARLSVPAALRNE